MLRDLFKNRCTILREGCYGERCSICFLISQSQVELSQRPLPLKEVITYVLYFHPAEYCLFLGVGLSKDKVNAVHCCLKHTLLFSNFTIVPGEIKGALSTCHCVEWAFMSYLITGKLFFDWAEVWAEFGHTMGLDDFHRNTMRRQQRCCLKSLSRCWAPTLYCGQRACELQ